MNKKIKCTKCGHEMVLDDLLLDEVGSQLRKDFEIELVKEKQAFELQASILKDKLTDGIADGIAKQKDKLAHEQSEVVKALEKELSEKSTQVKDLNQAKSDIIKLKRDNEEAESRIKLEQEKLFTESLNAERIKIQAVINDEANFKMLERENVITQLKESLKTAQQKAEQGLTQLQGEVQELAIEEWLLSEFPIDIIGEVKKGANGADCLQTINTNIKNNCGQIYYESKRTKTFSPSWISKFKADMLQKNASVGVLVTSAMPPSLEQAGMVDGIWICTFDEFKVLSKALREALISVDNALLSQENKGDKMVMLYDYLTGSEFRLQMENIVSGFTEMRDELEKEKRAMTGIWKRREKQIDKVILNTNFMHNSVKGIAGSAVQPIPLLELKNYD